MHQLAAIHIDQSQHRTRHFIFKSQMDHHRPTVTAPLDGCETTKPPTEQMRDKETQSEPHPNRRHGVCLTRPHSRQSNLTLLTTELESADISPADCDALHTLKPAKRSITLSVCTSQLCESVRPFDLVCRSSGVVMSHLHDDVGNRLRIKLRVKH